MDKWNNNSIQFPRLLAEIMATQHQLDLSALADSMDLSVAEVITLFDRAQAEWELIKDAGRLDVGEDDTRVKRGTFTFTFLFDSDTDPVEQVNGMSIEEIFEECDMGGMVGGLVGVLKFENVPDRDAAATALGSDDSFFGYIDEEEEGEDE